MSLRRIYGNALDDDGAILKSKFTEIANTFLRDVSFQMPGQQYDLTSMEDKVLQHLQSEDFSLDFIQRVYPAIQAGVAQAVIYYPFASPEVQESIAVYGSYCIILDDIRHEVEDDLRNFNKNLFSGQPQSNKLLQCMATWLKSASNTFGQYAGNMMMKETFDYSAALALENGFPLPPNATSFPKYFRMKNGAAETWALFTFPENRYPECQFLSVYLPVIPALMDYLANVNDLLSFYKEARDGETFNFVCNYAITHDMSPFDVLQLCSENIKQETQEIRSILAREPQMLRDIEQFMQGFIFYHLALPRYRLCELDIPEATVANELLYGKSG